MNDSVPGAYVPEYDQGQSFVTSPEKIVPGQSQSKSEVVVPYKINKPKLVVVRARLIHEKD